MLVLGPAGGDLGMGFECSVQEIGKGLDAGIFCIDPAGVVALQHLVDLVDKFRRLNPYRPPLPIAKSPVLEPGF